MGSRVSVRHFRDYCGECAHWRPCEDERLQGHGLCEYDDRPEGVVSFAYYLTDVARAATEPACVLFESGGRGAS